MKNVYHYTPYYRFVNIIKSQGLNSHISHIAQLLSNREIKGYGEAFESAMEEEKENHDKRRLAYIFYRPDDTKKYWGSQPYKAYFERQLVVMRFHIPKEWVISAYFRHRISLHYLKGVQAMLPVLDQVKDTLSTMHGGLYKAIPVSPRF